MVGLLAGIFVAIILFSGTLLIEGFELKTSQYIFIITASVIAGMIFKPTADFLERKFNSIFASQGYNPQVVLNKVSATVSSTIDVDDLLVGISEAITQTMGVRRVDSVALSKGEVIYRSTDVNSYPSDEEFGVLGDENVNIDETSDQNKIAILRKYGINIYIVLKSQSEKLGYLMIGPKNNGLSYDATDINTFSNIASQLSVTLKNIAYYFEVKSFNKTLQQRVDDATEKLRDANEKLKEADESKDDFISMASHQLSSPISSIEGYLSMANNGYLGEMSPKLAEALKAAGGRTKVMKGIISDLLNVSHMTAGKFSLDLSPNDLVPLIEEEIKQSEPLAKQQQTEISFHKPPQHIDDIMCDGPKVGQVISNFITNALNYTPKGHVDVYLDRKPTGIEVRVVDDGIGVPADQQAKLFQKFFRADNAKKERPSGNGIGLYVAKKVIEEHGGKIIFQSTQGHGSTFGFTLPLHPVNNVPPDQHEVAKEPAQAPSSPPETVHKDVV